MLNFIIISFVTIFSSHTNIEKNNNDGFTFENKYACGCTQFKISNSEKNAKYEWNFGDNTTSNQKDPEHCYKSFGKYKVTLKITKSNGTQTKYDQLIEWSNPEK